MITDMTEGKPGKILWRFALPVLCSVAFQQMYQIADSVIAGRCVGGSALAAIGASYPVTMLFMAVATGLNLGCSVAVSQLFGAKDYSRMKTAVSTSILSTLAISLVLMAAGLLFCEGMLGALGTDAYIFDDAALYLRIYLYGMAFLFLYNICTGIFNALGDSRTPLYLLIGSSVGNVILDYVLVTAFDMGVAGVAWATFLAQGMASVLALLTLLRRLRKVETDAFPLFSGLLFMRIAGLAVPSILQQSFISVGNLFIQWLVNGYGWTVVGGFSAAMKLNNFVIVGLTALGSAMSSFAAQNIGAERFDRVTQGLKAGAKMSVGVAVPFSLLFALGGSLVMRLFVSASEHRGGRALSSGGRAVLRRHLAQAVRRRRAARRGRDDRLHDLDLFRPYSARRAGLLLFADVGRSRHLVELAGRLVHRHRSFASVRARGRVEAPHQAGLLRILRSLPVHTGHREGFSLDSDGKCL